MRAATRHTASRLAQPTDRVHSFMVKEDDCSLLKLGYLKVCRGGLTRPLI